jgi:hypothetical protein
MLLAAYCLLLTSCAAPKVSRPDKGRYQTVLDKWTREGKVYEDLETKLLINATFKSEEFRKSYVDEYSSVYMLDSEKVKKLMRDELEAPKKYHEFFISVHTPILEWSDLEKKEPVWALYLLNDAGVRVSPVELKRIRERGPVVTRFYPYHTDWSLGHIVKFPLSLPDGRELITPETKYIKLVMTGPPGKGELVWELK